MNGSELRVIHGVTLANVYPLEGTITATVKVRLFFLVLSNINCNED